jgi:hypothetical protein
VKYARHHGLLLALIAFVLLLALPTLTYPLGRDQGEFATIGRGLLEGRVPYRDLWNPKPPAVFYLYAGAMSIFGQTTAALRALDLLLMPGMMLGLYWIGTRLYSRTVGLWAALLFAIFYFTETFWTLTQNDGLVLLPMILALACVVEASHRPARTARLLLFIAGALAGIVFWFKYPFVLFIGLLALVIWMGFRFPVASYRRSTIGDPPPASSSPHHPITSSPASSSLVTRRSLLFLLFLLGLLTTGLSFALYLLTIGAMPDLIESARVTSQYTALTFNWPEFSALLTTALGFRWSHWGLLFVLAGLGLILSCLRLPQRSNESSVLGTEKPSTTNQQSLLTNHQPLITNRQSLTTNHQPPATSHQRLTLLLWLLTALAIMLVQAKAYDYHWLPMLPPLALLGGVGVEGIQKWISGRDLSRPYGMATAIIIGGVLIMLIGLNTWGRAWPYLTGQIDQQTYYQGFQAGEFVASESLEVAEYLRARTTPGDSLTIWGFRPEIYYLSGLNPATRFIFQFPLVGSWYPLKWRQQHVDTLWAAMPPYVIVAQVDYMPWVTGTNADSNTLLQGYTELNNWLIANYERDAQIGNLFLWRRKS